MSPFRRLLPDVPRETALVVGLVSGSHVVNHTYLVLFPPILAVLAAEFEVSLAMLGVAMGVQAFVNTACQLPYGYLADRYDRTLTLGLCLLLGALGVAVIAAAPTFEWVLVGQAVLGLGVAGHHPAHFPLLADVTSEQQRGQVFSVHGFAGKLGFATPPILITAVIAVPGLSWRHAFGLLAAVGFGYAAVAVATLLGRVDPAVRQPNRDAAAVRSDQSFRKRVRGAVRSMLDAPGVLALGGFALVASTVMWGVTSYVVVLLTDEYGVALETANLALSATFVAGAVFILLGGDLADRVGPGPVLVGSYALVATFVFALASLAVPPLVAVACAVLGGSVGSLGLPARDKLADAFSARADLGKSFATVTVGIMLGNTLAPPLFGALIESTGFRATFATIAAVALGATGLIVLILRVVGDGTGTETGSATGH